MDELTLSTDELQVVLNHVAAEGQELVVQAPFYGVTLFTYDPAKGEIRHGVSRDALEEARGRILPSPKRLQDDLAGWFDVRDALVASGLVAWRDEASLRARLRTERDRAREASNPNATYLAFDTNLLYDRFPSRTLGSLVDDLSAFQFTVSAAVVAELDAAVDAKYTQADLQTLGAKLVEFRRNHGERLLSRPMKKARKAKMALSEVRRLEKERRGLRCPAEPISEDKERNDRIIAQSYARLSQDARASVLLLSADQQMPDRALTARITYIPLRLPDVDAIPTGAADERSVCRLIHDLATAFGVLRFVGHDILVRADWSGKTPEQADAEMVCLESEHGATLGKIAPQVELCRRVVAAAADP